jgi:two-component system response regulator HydG
LKPIARNVLIVDDQLEMARSLCDGLADRGFRSVPVATGREALRLIENEPFDAIVTDLRMSEIDGFEILETSQKAAPDRPVIVMTAFSAIESAVESIRRGAYHYLTKPFQVEELSIFLERALAERQVRREATALKNALRERTSPHTLIGDSEPMRRLRDFIGRVADTAAPVLILGETGTGKSLVARALHDGSPRASAPFVSINCAALPEALLESELFGHVRGAFTGATVDRSGLFVEANGGTLFLDEIGEMAPALQAKMLHVLERAVVRPVGASRERSVDVRILAATHRDLRAAVADGKFRADLLYRLDVVSVTVPPLRQRREDVPALVTQFLEAARQRHPRTGVDRLSPDALDALARQHWAGNVRELAHVIERVILLGRGPIVTAADLPDLLRPPETSERGIFHGEIMPIRELQRRYVAWALDQMDGQKGKTAEKLGIDAKTLWSWLQAPEQ